MFCIWSLVDLLPGQVLPPLLAQRVQLVQLLHGHPEGQPGLLLNLLVEELALAKHLLGGGEEVLRGQHPAVPAEIIFFNTSTNSKWHSLLTKLCRRILGSPSTIADHLGHLLLTNSLQIFLTSRNIWKD